MDKTKNKRINCGTVYKKVYPEKPRSERIERQKHNGRPVCPECGSEALKKDGNGFICLRCGFHWRSIRRTNQDL